MLDAGSKFEVSYRQGTKKIEVVCLAGRKFGRLVQILNKCGNVKDENAEEMFEDWIPTALGYCLQDEKRAADMWDNELTMQDAMEIVNACVAKHSLTDDDKKKSE